MFYIMVVLCGISFLMTKLHIFSINHVVLHILVSNNLTSKMFLIKAKYIMLYRWVCAVYVLLTVYSGGGGGGGYILVGRTASHNCQLCELFRGNIGNNQDIVQPPLQFHLPLLMREKIFATKNYSNFACQLNKLPECGLPAFTT